MANNENRCWPGYEPVKGKEKNEQGSCRKKADSKLTASEQKFRAKREKQLDEWKKEHPKSPRKAAQGLGAPKKATKKRAAKKTAARKSTAKKSRARAS